MTAWLALFFLIGSGHFVEDMKLRTIRAVEIELGVPDNPTHLAGFYPPRYWSHQDDALKASLMIVTTESDQVIILKFMKTRSIHHIGL